MIKNKIKLVGFDLDDCLFDSTRLSKRARVRGIKAMIELGLKIDEDKAIQIIHEIVNEYGSNSSKHYNYFIRRLIENENYLTSRNEKYKFIAGAIIAYHQEKIDTIKPYDDVKPCLYRLKKMKIKTAIITDGKKVKQYEKILRLGIHDLIDLVTISDDIRIKKPNPRLLSHCLKSFNVKESETIYIGDRLDKDIVPANENNFISILIHRGGKYDKQIKFFKKELKIMPDYEITNLNEIFDIIKKENK